jgi:hypothetical protein
LIAARDKFSGRIRPYGDGSPMRDIRRWGVRALGGLGAVVLLGACGTTVPLATQRALQDNGGLNGAGVSTPGTSGSQAGAAGAVAGSLAGSGSTNSGGAGVGPVASGGTRGAGGAAGTVPGSAAGANLGSDGPGVSATTINVGELYDPNNGAEDAALGFGGLNPGNTQAETNAVIAYINAHGGVAGRKLNAIWYAISTTSNIQQQEQGACTFWTTDNKVFTFQTGTAVLDQCAANAHAIGPAAGDLAQEDTPILNQYPTDINIDGMSLDRSMRYTVEGLERQGYFSPGAKVGIATWDQSDFQWSITHAALPALAAVGIQNPPVAYVTVPETESDVSSSSADISNAILKFRQAGIDHVLLFDGTAGINSGGTMAILWMNAANGQAWYPTYGLNSTSGLTTGAADEPARELQNSLAIGWNPSLDLSSGDFSAQPMTTDGKLCLQIMSSAGQTPSSQNAEGVALSICDHYFFLKFALDKVSGPLNQATALAAINSVGTTYPIISNFENNFTQNQHDGPYFVRNAAFVTSCSCFKYTSNPYNPG